MFDFHPEGWRDLSSGNLEHSVCAPDVSLWKTEGERIESGGWDASQQSIAAMWGGKSNEGLKGVMAMGTKKEKEINSFFFFFFDKMIGLMDLGDEE